MSWMTLYRSRLQSAEEAVRTVASGNKIYMGSGCAAPHALITALTDRAEELQDVEIIHHLTLGDAPYIANDMKGHFRLNDCFVGSNTRDAVNEGRADYVPVHLHEMPRLFRRGVIPLDCALVVVSPPDEHGFCSFGIEVGVTKPAALSARVIVAEVNRKMPRTLGDAFIHVSKLTHAVPVNYPLAELLTSPPKGLWHEVATDDRKFEVIARPLETGPTPGGWVLVIRDVTREREIQQRAQQRERLATVGQLAAGIAHDFNNIMATIVLYAQMLSQTEGLSPRSNEWLATINQQAMHATNLTQQILDFSRRAMLKRQPLNLLPLLKEQVKLLERTLPENIRVEMAVGPGEHTVNADVTRIQQMIMNLVLNSRDAMPEGGELHIALDRLLIKAGEPLPSQEMEPGEWIRIMVTDNGTGIPQDVLPRVFEPFFTTKAPLGTGLGLSQVYGIVAQHGGHVTVESEVGEGTTFALFLPALPGIQHDTTAQATPIIHEGRGETILIVEDDPTTRAALVDGVEGLNYQVLEAGDGREALDICRAHEGRISLVLSDLIMPEMGGMALLEGLQQQYPEIKMVMLSGHPLDEIKGANHEGIAEWLQKPIDLDELAEALRRAL